MSELSDPPSGSGATPEARYQKLLDAALDLAGEHDLDHILERMVRCAADVADARYAALGIYDESRRIERFLHHGLDASTADRIGAYPTGRGLLGEVIVADGPIRLADLTTDSRSHGFPEGHPEMRSFLGVPVGRGPRRFGSLYVTEKRGGSEFTVDDEQLLVTLAAFAAAAIESVMLAASEERERVNRELLGRVIAAQEAERARVSRDLHDQIGQSLTSVLLGQRLVIDALARANPDLVELRARTNDVRALVADALEEVRQLAFELRPTVLDDIGLRAAVERLASDLASRHHLDVRADVGVDEEHRLPSNIETAVYRVVQEALTNVARHARARRASVTIVMAGDRVRAEVIDDGNGFDPGATRPASLGLAGMAERAALVDGSLAVTSAPGAGTTVSLEVPLG